MIMGMRSSLTPDALKISAVIRHAHFSAFPRHSCLVSVETCLDL